MKLLLTLTFLFCTSLCFAQRQNVYFLKNNGTYVQIKDSADYVRVVREPDSGTVEYNVMEFYIDGSKKRLGKSTEIDPSKFEGTVLTYFNSGKKESIINYKNGSKRGDEIDYYPNGKIYLQKSYIDNGKATNDFNDDFLLTTLNDSTGKTLITNGNGHYLGYDSGFKDINEEGEIKNGKMNGEWKGTFKDVHTTFTENYNDGTLVSGVAVTDDGKTINYTKARAVLPEFKGGVVAFGQYLSENIHYTENARLHNIEGKVILTFVVDKTGLISNIKVAKSVNPILDEEAVRVLKKSPKWLPGTRFGLPVRVQYSVPISFALSN